MSNRDLKKFGKRLKELRIEKDLTQEQLAEKLGLSANYIGMIERGERSTSLSKLFTLSKALEIKMSELFNFD